MSKINDILIGWSKYVRDKVVGHVDDEVKRKIKICESCPLITPNLVCNPYKQGVVEKTYETHVGVVRKGMMVSGCGCFLPAKVRSDSQCPLRKW